MGTRHLIMVIKDGETKVAQYGQWDGYPSGQGVEVLAFIRKLDIAGNLNHFNEQLDKCEFVDDDRINVMFNERTEQNNLFPQITRNAGADILNIIANNKDDILELSDQSDFANDSLMCEWAYVLDMDNNILEVYEGFNHEPVTAVNRFQGEGIPNYDGSTTYYPVKHVKSWGMGYIPTDEEFINALEIDEEDEEEVEEIVENEFTKDAIQSVLDHIRSGDHGNDLVTDRLCNYLDANVDEILEAYEDIDNE